MTYQIITYGCQMNKSDSERIAAILEEIGFKPSSKNADLMVINICSVRQSAIDRAYSQIKKRKGCLLLTGCILKKDKTKVRKFCDGIFEMDKLAELPILLKKLGFKIKELPQGKIEHYLEITPQYQSNIIGYVPIMTGCNNFCSYCVVPYVRGKEVSRPAEEIVCEAKALVQRGIKEIWLLGQNVNSYKSPAPTAREESGFAKLLKVVNDIPGNFWVRFTSSHPKDLTDEMIEAFAKSKKAAPYFNLPIQTGDDEILKAMNRPYTVERYKELIKKARTAFEQHRQGLEKKLAISTDVIVGFPSETKKHFENTKKTFKEIGFAFAYISRYSPRPQTAASKLKDDVSSQEKKQSEKELLKIVEKTALHFNKKFVNKVADVLILEKKGDFYFGKTRHHQTIRFPAPGGEGGVADGGDGVVSHAKGEMPASGDKIGKFVKAKIIKAMPYGLEGKIQ